jgi:hypothetical protein
MRSSTPLLQCGQRLSNCWYFHFCGRSHHGQKAIGYITPPPQPHSHRRSYRNPLGAFRGSTLERRSAMARPHHGQNECLSDTTQPQ